MGMREAIILKDEEEGYT